MGEATLEASADGRYTLRGDLSFDTVPALCEQGERLFSPGEGELTVDLGAVRRADSAGVALLVEWTRQARAAGRAIHFTHIPAQMLAIARVSSLDEVLPLVPPDLN